MSRTLCFGMIFLAAAFYKTSAQQQAVPPSPREQLQQYVTQLQANPTDDALRTKIIQLALTLDPKPAVPPDLPETIGAATYAFKSAQSSAELVNAANLYAKAVLEAPWRADLYFNEGLAFEKAKSFDVAIKAYQFYLLAAPNASDSEAVRENIGALKYQLTKQQQQDEVRNAADAAAQAQRQEEQRLEGRYIRHDQISVRGSSIDTDGILDVKQGGVIAGQIILRATGYYVASAEGRIGRYEQNWTTPIPLIGHSFHREEHYNNGGSTITDGVISDDGSSITLTTVGVYADGHRTTNTEVFHRQ